MPEQRRIDKASSLKIGLQSNPGTRGACSKCGGGGFLSLDPVAFCDCAMGQDCRRAHQRIQTRSASPLSAQRKSIQYPGAADSRYPLAVVSAGRALDPALWVELPNEHEQTEPQLLPILLLHRHDDGYVVFSSKSGDDMADQCAVRIDELQTYFPQYREQLLKDSFVGINADWRLARGKGPRGYPFHRTDGLRYLCACYVDLDCYKLGLQFGAVFAAVISYQDQGKIPPGFDYRPQRPRNVASLVAARS